MKKSLQSKITPIRVVAIALVALAVGGLVYVVLQRPDLFRASLYQVGGTTSSTTAYQSGNQTGAILAQSLQAPANLQLYSVDPNYQCPSSFSMNYGNKYNRYIVKATNKFGSMVAMDPSKLVIKREQILYDGTSYGIANAEVLKAHTYNGPLDFAMAKDKKPETVDGVPAITFNFQPDAPQMFKLWVEYPGVPPSNVVKLLDLFAGSGTFSIDGPTDLYTNKSADFKLVTTGGSSQQLFKDLLTFTATGCASAGAVSFGNQYREATLNCVSPSSAGAITLTASQICFPTVTKTVNVKPLVLIPAAPRIR